MKNVMVAFIIVVGFCGTVFAGDCANGRCNLARRSAPVVSSSRVVRTHEGSVSHQNAYRSNRRAVRTSR